MPVALWQHIAECSNFYMHGQLEYRVHAYFEKKKRKDFKDKTAGRPVGASKNKTVRDVRQEFLSVKRIMPHELCVYIGLLVARTIMPNREKLANHWRQDDVGAISRGCFGQFTARDGFMEISRNLHFNSNQDPRAKSDQAWKIRSVVTFLQKMFASAIIPPPELSFDEAMLPSRSSYDQTRVYMKDKHHK
ncbi:hypothetical protein PI124_g8713 [Phytophthora idaei]|nr:hypothetical protein PI125_g10626 [Phytophthora idaei]KAG3153628.1 hypothetical protein PI126_g9995 [Phytophthora idaei]KAG3246575.1 hypothetical protein PI124_g8713 [Phytophthora idaei]